MVIYIQNESKYNDWTGCGKYWRFQTVFEEVGELVNIPDAIDEVQENEDIHPPHCDSEHKKVHKLSMVDI